MPNSIFRSLYKRPYFEGWYFKHRSPQHTLILIPAWHMDGNGDFYGSLQIILDDQVHRITFPARDCHIAKDRFYIRFGQTVFSENGCHLHLDLTPTLTIRGHIRYGTWHRPIRSFMGPFRYLPLPCRHDVLSLSHRLRGRLQIILPPEPTVSVPLLAPKAGTMERIIEEHPRCPIRWQLYQGKVLIFDQESPYGSYELA